MVAHLIGCTIGGYCRVTVDFPKITVTINIPFPYRLHPTAYPVIGANLRVEPYPEADFSVRIDFSEAIEELDVKSIEFVDESSMLSSAY